MYRLYYVPSNASLAPHILLEELGAAHELLLVDREHNEHKGAAYLKLNPSGRIPVLLDGELVLSEAAAICLHLADRHPEAALAPPLGTPERAEFYKWLMYMTNTVQPEILNYFYPERLSEDAAGAAAVKRQAEARIGAMLDLIEAALAGNADAGRGPYLLGAAYTAVDPYLLMLARWTRGFAHPARARPHLGAYLERIIARPAVRRAFVAEGLAAPWF